MLVCMAKFCPISVANFFAIFYGKNLDKKIVRESLNDSTFSVFLFQVLEHSELGAVGRLQ